MNARLCFVDLETTGLEDHHEPWEVGLILRDLDEPAESRWRFFVQPERMDLADPVALEIGRFHERTADVAKGLGAPWWVPGERTTWTGRAELAEYLRLLLDGAVLIGSNAQFDSRMLRLFLARHDLTPTWHYRPVDVGAMAYGYLCGFRRGGAALAGIGVDDVGDHPGPLPWSSTELAKALGIERTGAHEALPDAEFAMAVYDAVTGGGS